MKYEGTSESVENKKLIFKVLFHEVQNYDESSNRNPFAFTKRNAHIIPGLPGDLIGAIAAVNPV